MKIGSGVLLPFLLAASLATILLPGAVLAQEGRTDLILSVVWAGKHYNEVTAGKDNAIFLEVRNTGNRSITNIKLSADKPEGWAIEFRPAKIDYLGPGSLQTVDVNIKPSGKTAKGEYRVTFVAEANEIRKVENFWVRVEAASSWLWVGAIVAAMVVAAFVVIFVRSGRQQN